MALRMCQIAIDAADPAALARFWAEALDQQVFVDSDGDVIVASDAHTFPGLIFVPVPEAKQVKNRLHIDLAADNQEAEVARLLSLGAVHVDVGQSADVTWQVLSDPEGNEFCVLAPKQSFTG
ncbi:VOC family protein [Streptomyces sp. NPDC088725]|uniref:VOC family protein n=1 Tax=Streptomyces sp. NPDC088725 TaxID=3365873 RepID=UPI00381859D4